MRASGRTTRMLHDVVGLLLDNNSRVKTIIVTAEGETYALHMHRKVVDILRVYGCADIFLFSEGKIVGNNKTVRFQSRQRREQGRFNLPMNSRVFSDHYWRAY